MLICEPVSLRTFRIPGPGIKLAVPRAPTGVPPLSIINVPPVPPVPPSSDQIFVAVQPYTFVPAGAVVSKNRSASVQVAGNTAPDFTGAVNGRACRFTFFD